ncbi:4335_t:CDS:2, partial [Funneliformis geosporum]
LNDDDYHSNEDGLDNEGCFEDDNNEPNRPNYDDNRPSQPRKNRQFNDNDQFYDLNEDNETFYDSILKDPNSRNTVQPNKTSSSRQLRLVLLQL